jgi:Lipopolysaccharide-assembly
VSCGYSTSQAQRVANGYTKVYVNQAMDNTADVGAASTLTRVLRHRVDLSRVSRLAELNEAEVVLEARIDGASDVLGAVVTGAGQTPTVPKYTLAMRGSARLIDKNAKVVWQSGSVSVEEDYLSGLPICGSKNCGAGASEGALPATESNRRRALERAAEQLANELYTRLMEGF